MAINESGFSRAIESSNELVERLRKSGKRPEGKSRWTFGSLPVDTEETSAEEIAQPQPAPAQPAPATVEAVEEETHRIAEPVQPVAQQEKTTSSAPTTMKVKGAITEDEAEKHNQTEPVSPAAAQPKPVVNTRENPATESVNMMGEVENALPGQSASLSSPWNINRSFDDTPSVAIEKQREEDKTPEYRPTAPDARGLESQAIADGTMEDVDRVAQRTEAKKAVYSQGRDQIMAAGEIPVPVPVNRGTNANRRFKKAFENLRDLIALKVKDKHFNGTAFWDYIYSDPFLQPHEVSLGTANIMEALREPNSKIIEWVNDALREAGREAEVFTVEECLEDMTRLIRTINGYKKAGAKEWAIPPLDFDVVVDKAPVNIGPSIQVRTLRIHMGRGIKMHPTQAKSFNADFDGDPGSVNFDPEQLGKYGRAMDWLLGPDGQPTMDIDLFPLDEIPIPKGKSVEKMKKEVFELALKGDFSWFKNYGVDKYAYKKVHDVIDIYVDLCVAMSKGQSKKVKKAWRDLAEAISEAGVAVAKVTGDHVNIEASRILKSLYDFATERRLLSIKTQYESLFDADSGTWGGMAQQHFAETGDPFVDDMAMLVDEISAGRPPMNLEEFTVFFNRQYGNLDNKNIPFRLISDLGKAINRTDLVTIGSSFFDFEVEAGRNWTIEELWKFTMVAGISKLISGRARISSYELAVSTAVRQMVLMDCPLPVYDLNNPEVAIAQFQQWVVDFTASYNRAMGMLAISQISWRGGMSISRDEASSKFRGIEDENDLAYAIEKVFGEYTIEYLLPFYSGESVAEKKRADYIQHESKDPTRKNPYGLIRAKYKSMPISKFIMSNRIWQKPENHGGRLVSKGSAIKSRYQGLLAGKVGEDSLQPMDLIHLLSDRKSKQLGEYDQQWLQATQEQFDKIVNDSIGDQIRKGDLTGAARDYLEMLYLMSPDMFSYYRMDSPDTFANSYWGKKIFSAKTVEEFRNTLFEMMLQYRLAPASAILAEIETVNNDTEMKPEKKERRLEALEARYMFELDSLRSSSDAWDIIVMEILQGDYRWRSMHDGTHHNFNLYAEKTTKVGWSVNAKDFWGSEGILDEYPTLLSFLQSDDVALELKTQALADLVKFSLIAGGTNKSHILGMIAHHPDRLHAGNRFDMDKGLRDDINAIKESSKRMTTYLETQENIEEDAAKIIKAAKEDKPKFERQMARLSSDPGYRVHIGTELAADAIASIYDKTYADTEKGQQQARVNGFFGCLMFQRLGGYFTHLHQTDNVVVNTVGADQIQPMDIVKVLGDPNLKIWVYDQFGRRCREPLTRSSLCGGDSIDDVISYLEKNPKIACMCQRYTCGVANDVDGTAKLNTMDPTLSPDGVTERAFAALADRPRFLALAALITPADGRVGRNLAESVNVNLKDLCMFIAKQSYLYERGLITEEDVIKSIEDTLGISEEAIASLRYDKLTFKDEAYFTGEDEFHKQARELVEEVTTEILDCMSIMATVMKQDEQDGWGGVYAELPQVELGKHRFDESSLVAYYDAKQHLGGARTEMMIGVEGSETKKNLVLKQYLRGRRPNWTMKKGVPVRMTEEDHFYDESTVRAPWRQLHPIAKFLEIKREFGAETFNLKAKKWGDDNTNSIVKFIRMVTNKTLRRLGLIKQSPVMPNGSWTIEDGMDLVEKLESFSVKPGPDGTIDEEERQAALDQAIAYLAIQLRDADVRLGYIDVDENGSPDSESFVLSDYYERADLMLRMNSDGTIVIRTLEQISRALNSRLSDEAIMSGDKDVINREIEEIVETLGTDADPFLSVASDEDIFHDVLYEARTYNSVGSGLYQASRGINPRASSVERNLEQLTGIYKSLDAEKRAWVEEHGPVHPNSPLNKRSTPKTKNETRTRSSNLMMYVKKENEDIWKELNRHVYTSIKESDTYKFDLVGVDFDLIVPRKNNETGEIEEVSYAGLRLADIQPGPQSMVLFTEQPTADDEKLRWCRDYGMTAVFAGLAAIPMEYAADIIRIDANLYILPFFDMRLNGAESDVMFDGVRKPKGPAPCEIPIHRNNIVAGIEETTGEFKLGDSVCMIAKNLADRVRVHFNSSRPSKFSYNRLFPTVIATHPDSNFRMVFCEKAEVQDLIDGGYDQQTLSVRGYSDAIVDIGILPGDTGYARERERYDTRLAEYRENFANADENGILTDDCSPDSIIGFVKIVDDTGDTKGYAPLWAFHLEESGRVPQKFSVTRLEYAPETNSFYMSWKYTGGLTGHLIKFFEGIGASNKMMVSDTYVESRKLLNGLEIDAWYSTSTVASRLFSSNKRLHTMVSMILMTRIDPKYSYNFGEDDGAFPDGETVVINGQEMPLKEAVRQCIIPRNAWKVACKWDERTQTCNIRFHEDPEIDALVRLWVTRCIRYGTVNPLTLLATKDAQGRGRLMYTEFEAFLETSIGFQNALMKFFNRFHPELCPPSVVPPKGYEDDPKDWSKGCLFRPVFEDPNNDDFGVLQVLVPHRLGDGEEFTYVPENLFLSFSFMGEEFSGFKKVNFNAYNRSIDNINVGANIGDWELSQMMAFARAEMSDNATMTIGSWEPDPDDFMVDREEMSEEEIEERTSKKDDGETRRSTMYTPTSVSDMKFRAAGTDMISKVNQVVAYMQDAEERSRLRALSTAEETKDVLKKFIGRMEKMDGVDPELKQTMLTDLNDLHHLLSSLVTKTRRDHTKWIKDNSQQIIDEANEVISDVDSTKDDYKWALARVKAFRKMIKDSSSSVKWMKQTDGELADLENVLNGYV